MSASSKAYAEGDGYFKIRFLMIRAHETLLNGLGSVYKQLGEDHSHDLHNWLGYVEAWSKCVHHHHSLEEKTLFPVFQEHGLNMETELEQHDKLHHDLDELAEKISKWRADPSTYDPSALKGLLDELAPNFRQHLKEEVEHLSKDRLEPKISSEKIVEAIAKLEAEATKGDPFVEPVFMMSHTDPEHKYWSNLGWIMYRIVIPGLSWRHAGYWKYAPEPLNV